MELSIFESIKKLLTDNTIAFKLVHHEPTFTSEDSARVRGEDVRVGGKALVMKVGDQFKLLVLSAALKADSEAIKQHFGAKKLRFASKEELLELTGLVPGSVPPFGNPILPLPLYLDISITQNEKIAFNAGSPTDSIIMRVEDYIKIAQPEEIFLFSLQA